MRIFTAIPLPSKIKEEVLKITRGRLPISYINTTNSHVTLNFFGELTDLELQTVKTVFPGTAKDLKKLEIEFYSLEKFHQQIHLKVAPSPQLLSLQAKLEKEFEKFGFIFQDRSFYPHVKLTNLHMDKVMNPQRKLSNFPQEELKKLSFKAEKIVLYESKLLLHHPKYTPLIEANLEP